jgi:hypothetical protein
MTQHENLYFDERKQEDEMDVPFVMDVFERNGPSRKKVQEVQLKGESPQYHEVDGSNDLDVI